MTVPCQTFLSVMGVAFIISSCATRPLPENVTGVDTETIVRKVRCETRDAIRNETINYMLNSGDDRTVEKARDLKSFPDKWLTFSENDVNEETRGKLDIYKNAAVAFEFTLDIKEYNNTDSSFSLLNPFSTGKSTFGFGEKLDLTRENNRDFRSGGTFTSFVLLDENYCDHVAVSQKNVIYPIVGNIGISEIVHTFISLNEKDELFPNPGIKDSTPSMADTITFDTIIDGSINPMIVFTAGHPGLSAASLNLEAKRDDSHKILIAMSMPTLPSPIKETANAHKPGLKAQVASPTAPASSALRNAFDVINVQNNKFLTDALQKITQEPNQ